MENSRKDKEWQIIALIESTDFEALTESEQQIVLREMTANEYTQRRKVVIESSAWIHGVTPLPLILEKAKSKWLIPIPLYQSIAAVAAVFLFSFLIFRSNGNALGEKSNSDLVAIDTVYIEKCIIDTIIEYDTRYVDRIFVKNQPDVQQVQETMTSVNVGATESDERPSRVFPALPDLSELQLENVGSSAINDKTIELLDGYSIDH